jgi:malate permease and related proteins
MGMAAFRPFGSLRTRLPSRVAIGDWVGLKIESLVLLLGCLTLGWLVARFGKPPPDLSPRLNWWVINIALPALVLELIPSVQMDPHLWFLPVAMWLVFLGGWGLMAFIGRRLGWSQARIGAAALSAGLGNTALVGFPLIEMLRQKEGLILAAFADQLGCSIALAVGGITVAAIYGGGKPQPRVILKRVLLFPPFLALVTGIIAGMAGGWPPLAEGLIARIGATLTPVALFSIGLSFKLRVSREHLNAAGLALGWKLAIAPVVIFALATLVDAQGLLLAVAVLQAGMAPMASVPILCQQYGLETEVANTALGAGLAISLFSVPFIDTLLR